MFVTIADVLKALKLFAVTLLHNSNRLMADISSQTLHAEHY